MKTMCSTRKHHYLARVGTFLAAVALIAGMVSCGEVTPPVQYELIVSSTEGGSGTTPGEGTFTYSEGEKVSLAAIPDEGYEFVHWTGDVGEIADVEDPTTTITMNNDYSITATFAVKQYSLVIQSTEGGSVTTPGEAAYTYDKSEVVNLVAVADEGYVFINWTGDVSTIADVNAASTTITMNGGYSITANFAGTIQDWYDLDAIRDNLDGSYVLMNDLDSSTAGYKELASPTANGGKGWEPVGSLFLTPLPPWNVVDRTDPFTGSLDGLGYEVRDLFIDRPDEDGVGLFGCVSGLTENLGIVNAEVTGDEYVGGLVGGNEWEGYVSNCYCSGDVTGSVWVGGLVGGNWGTVGNSSASGSVTAGGLAGGLAGGNSHTVRNSYSSCNVTGSSCVGGLIGQNGGGGTVSNSYSSGDVTGSWAVGGLVGQNEGRGAVDKSYSLSSVTGESRVGGLVGDYHSGTVSNSYYNYDQVFINGSNIITIGAMFDEDFEQWLASDKFLDINERLSQKDGHYLINNVGDFKDLLAFGQDGSLKFRLTDDLDLGSEPNFYVPYLAGEFDGNGHTISNLRLNLDCVSQVGLFGCLGCGGTVTGVGAENANVAADSHVGGLVGQNDGAVSNSYFAGSVDGYCCVGGLVGWTGENGGIVSNSYYNYDEVLISQQHAITIGAMFDEDFEQWLTSDKFLDINERLSQKDGHYLINNVGDFKDLLAFGQDGSLKFRLTDDLDLGSEPNFYVPYLAGEFDGNGHTISNLRLNFDCVSQVGLFGCLASGAEVSEVGVENVNLAATGSEYVGGLVGRNFGTLSGSYSTGSITEAVNGGGLVGWNNGTVTDSYSTSDVTTYGYAGGLVGGNAGAETTLRNCYSTGAVTSSHAPRGFVGINAGSVTNCFWDIQTSGRATSAGGTGKTTAEMKNIATFSDAGWKIVAVAGPSEPNPVYIWNIVDGQTYPFLSWQPAS